MPEESAPSGTVMMMSPAYPGPHQSQIVGQQMPTGMTPQYPSHPHGYPTGPSPAYAPMSPQHPGHGMPYPGHAPAPGPSPVAAFSDPPAPPKSRTPLLALAIGLGILAAAVIVGTIYLVRGRRPTPVPSLSASTTEPTVPVAEPTVPPAVMPPPAVADTPPPAATPAPVETAEPPSTAASQATAPTTTAPATAAPATAAPATAAPATTPAPSPGTTPTAVHADAAPPLDPHAWNEAVARSRLSQANGVLAFCKRDDGVTGPGSASVTFANDGSVSGVSLDAPYAGTKTGDCVAGQFKRAKVNAFEGSPQTVRHSFDVPK